MELTPRVWSVSALLCGAAPIKDLDIRHLFASMCCFDDAVFARGTGRICMAFSTRCLLKFILCHCITCMSAGQLMAEDFTKLGGDLTSFFDGRFALQLPAPNVVDEERRNLMLTGFSIFHARFTQAQGLGPQVVNNSCGGCHVNNGRGSVKISRSPYRFNAMVIKVGLPGSTPHVVQSVPGIGDVLTDSNVTGKKRFHVVQKWRTVHGRYPDGNIYKLQKPYVQFRIPGQNSRKLLRSLRMTPAVIGPGLLESIPEAAVLKALLLILSSVSFFIFCQDRLFFPESYPDRLPSYKLSHNPLIY
ncbi:MAG: hypothetical protein DCC75_14270 [Proteobacteria bacterium]|nr:MAG: hypothetical protein DCC75_14270 [Pseudomonadota bacterium]